MYFSVSLGAISAWELGKWSAADGHWPAVWAPADQAPASTEHSGQTCQIGTPLGRANSVPYSEASAHFRAQSEQRTAVWDQIILRCLCFTRMSSVRRAAIHRFHCINERSTQDCVFRASESASQHFIFNLRKLNLMSFAFNVTIIIVLTQTACVSLFIRKRLVQFSSVPVHFFGTKVTDFFFTSWVSSCEQTHFSDKK
jgi:hypothetical protein